MIQDGIKSKNPKGPVLLVAAPIMYTFPFSFAYLAGYLRQHGEDVRMMFRDLPPVQMAQQIIAQKPLLVGFGNLYPELKEIKNIIAELDRAGRDFPIIIGGQMVSPIPEFAVKITGADIGAIGESEITLYKVVKALRANRDVCDISGLAIRDGDKVLLTGEGEYISNLKDLPAVPFELFSAAKWLPVGHWYAAFVPRSHWRYDDRVIPVHGGRGCPFSCNFCYHHSPFRVRGIDEIIRETASALERYDGNFLDISDDLVLSSPKRAEELIAGLRKLPRRVEFYLSAHFDIISRMSDSLLQELREVGCRVVGPGYESGSDRILNLIGKKFTTETIITQTERLKRAGIKAIGNFMIGQHTETQDDFEATLSLMHKTLGIDPDIEFTFSIMTPFPGSPLYTLAKAQGIIEDDKQFYDKYFEGGGIFDWRLIANLSAMSDRQIFDGYARMLKEYNEAKNKAFGSELQRISFFKKAAGQINYRFDKHFWSKSACFDPCRQITDRLCGMIMRRLEKKELLIRNKV